MIEYEVIHSKSPVFYDKFERKRDLQHQTHYCPGCGHGVAHKVIADAIEDLGLQNDTIFVSPVGCSVFGYYYFDTGNVQAAHGRAPAVATGVSRALPNKIVVTYQGDGDLAAIGTAEIIHAANRGEKIVVFFVNNAVYGMTGGQLAPTTLIGQTTTTTPWGRRANSEGFPLHVCELLSQIEMPVYIERVALSDNKNIMKARKAVRKALALLKERAGFTLVEILSPCPVNWKKDPVEARRFVAEQLIPVFPLGVFRDRKPSLPETPQPPQRSVPEVLGLPGNESVTVVALDKVAAKCNAKSSTIKIAGFGGQGLMLIGQLLAEIGMREGMEVSWLPSYGPEMRGGSAHCHVHLSHTPVGSPVITNPEVLIAMNEVALRKFSPQVQDGGLILYNSDKVPEKFPTLKAHIVCVPANEIADSIGSPKVANIVMLGALLRQTGCLSNETAVAVLNAKVKNPSLRELNQRALSAAEQTDSLV